MNVLLWILQGLLAALYLMGGGMKVFMWERISQQAERSPMAFSLVLAVLAVLVASGRFVR